MLGKSYSISKLAITTLEPKLLSSSGNVKQSLMLYSLVVRGSSIGTKNFASLYVGVPIADKIGLKLSSVTILWTLAEPYIIPGLESEGLKSLYYSMEIFFVSKIFKKVCYSIFYMDKVI